MRFIICLLFACICLPSAAEAESNISMSKARLIIETGAQAGGAFGVKGPTHSTFRGVTEIGVMFDKMPDRSRVNPAFGLVFYGAIGDEDFRMGIKPKFRYWFRPKWAADITAGYIFTSLESGPYVSQTGLAGGITLNYSSWLSFKGDINIIHVEDRPKYREGIEVGTIDGGREVSVYGGVSLRRRPGWLATVIGTSTFIAFAVIVMAEGGRS